MSPPRHVAVVGAGFSGLLTAVHLLARPEGPRVTLIERGAVGAGLAYGACAPEHLLNVRAGNMSAFPDRPDHFLAWLREHGGSPRADGAAFVSRRAYGRYLHALLHSVSTANLDLVRSEAIGLRRQPAGLSLDLADGRTVGADAVVLALGSLPPRTPSVLAPVAGAPGYVADPWAAGALVRVKADDPVLILGTGLTMVDVATSLAQHGHRGPLVALSRHGLTPRRHVGAPGPVGAGDSRLEAGALAAALQTFRKSAAADWRAAFDALRPATASLWRGMSHDQRARFLRHLRPYWDAHRHRLAPESADAVEALRASGRLRIAAGRLIRVDRASRGFVVVWRPRGSGRSETASPAWLVNCTGPCGDVERAADRFVASLVAEGTIRSDALRLGVDVDADCRPIDARGRGDPRLRVVGPMTRGAFWESTAVPDLRVQVAQVARDLFGATEDRLPAP